MPDSTRCVVVVVTALLAVVGRLTAQSYVLDDSAGLGRRFDGIGGLSGGGATSRLLVSYPQTQRDQILDLLFKPQFGASLHILKVEIGGDAQSTDGTEASHMHSADAENFKNGYEWWLMTEAKKRNPNIKLYGLSWAYPAWIGKGSGSPYTYPNVTAAYIIRWIQGAKEYYNLTIDYVGIWNERNYNIIYIKTLRKALDNSGLSHVEIVGTDSHWEIASDMLKDKELNESISIIGVHYPGTIGNADADATHKQLWASEDYSTFNDDVGAGCWARILNQNYVNGNMTSTISWNLIASYYSGLPFFRDGLMTAIEPWSGHYEVMGPIWISEPGFYYLRSGFGVGHLHQGGSYVTLINPQTKDFTIIIETMSHDHSVCIRPHLPAYNVSEQYATFQLMGSLANVTQLNRWNSILRFSSGSSSEYFTQGDPVKVVDGKFTLILPVDSVVTLSTLTGQQKGSFPNIPASLPFPVPYHDDFNGYPLYSEANYFADQTGVFEIGRAVNETHGDIMVQVVDTRPITWCNDANQPITIIGNITWQTVQVRVSALVTYENSSAFVAARVSEGGCGVAGAKGVFFWINTAGYWSVTTDLAQKSVIAFANYDIKPRQWYTLELQVQKYSVTVMIDGETVGSDISTQSMQGGFVGMGAGGFYLVTLDDFYLLQAY